ncbi:serine/threonine-protein kinase nek2, putative [Babesia caballi]|uniref:Serine/threonine-protein kinase nek2, putative n=1 Tax=Babesia caballi TaxID=5871 RepID=A0AAV4LTT8_BABCB|nr:serine/threonine-protein kinase nek2, putative [Babesia caballi]
MLRERILLENEGHVAARISQKLEKYGSLFSSASADSSSPSGSVDTKTLSATETAAEKPRPPMLARDLRWKFTSSFFYAIRPGDFSPLSPDGEVLERSGRIGVDFWRWHRDSAPLGYTPPLCTCKRTADTLAMLRRYVLGLPSPSERRVCENDVCRGLLYVPHSLLEVPLNRIVSNGSQFVRHVPVPNDTDVYCGNMKHTLVICTTSPAHEVECLSAIRQSDMPDSLIYRVNASGFIPYFKPHEVTGSIAPLMTVEPIDSDVSDSEENYGYGETFAVKRTATGLVIHKYDTSTQEVHPVEESMLRTWVGAEGAQSELREQAPVTSAEDYMICELIECFSNERRPLTFTLRGCNVRPLSPSSPKEDPLSDAHKAEPPRDDSARSRHKRRKLYPSEQRKPVSAAALERVHLTKIVDTLEFKS